jgi:sugar/nucleoside kinase (ribokinase family)
VHVSGYALVGDHGDEVAAAVREVARRRGLGASVDPASTAELARVGPARFLALTSWMGLAFPNLEEAALLTGEADPVQAARALAAHHGAAVVTCGADGAVAAAGGRWAHVPAPPVEVVDTTGAGDAFAAAYLAAHLAGGDLRGGLVAGATAAARAVAHLGAWPAGPPRGG